MKTPDIDQATGDLMASFARPRSRRGLLKGVAVGAAGTALAGGAMTGIAVFGGHSLKTPTAHAASGDTIPFILSAALTAEALAVTFYGQGIAHHNLLGLSGSDLAYLKAAQLEEQIHLNFLAAAGGTSLTTTFSFPNGAATFKSLPTFVATLGQLETAFVAAYLAAVKDFANFQRADLAQIAAQICGVECEHRTLARDIGGLIPADNVAFEAVLVPSVGAAVTYLASAGYLSPSGDNSYQYSQVSTSAPILSAAGITNTTP